MCTRNFNAAISSPAFCLVQRRYKTVKVSAYRRPPRASPTGQARKAHIGVKRLAAEYVSPGDVLVKQRKPVAQNPDVTRNRHFKIYPGENVGVSPKTTTLFALAAGRVKYTHDVCRNVKLVNVLPEPPDELLREDLWRYRTEHVSSVQDNCALVWRRVKAAHYMSSEDMLLNPPRKPPPRARFLSRNDPWNNQAYPDLPINYRFPPKTAA
ncbi:mitochondrial ribosomal protein l27 [Babesia caballi]|uniref:Mitochondrial ribosomal protein l27 n=1 Tax=Babesia caballi TaxID=5871 RepID=A0AAV4LVJ2_BABCB|nr:mitochondrial ribosomal protein l27 [Babesia caballi]